MYSLLQYDTYCAIWSLLIRFDIGRQSSHSSITFRGRFRHRSLEKRNQILFIDQNLYTFVNYMTILVNCTQKLSTIIVYFNALFFNNTYLLIYQITAMCHFNVISILPSFEKYPGMDFGGQSCSTIQGKTEFGYYSYTPFSDVFQPHTHWIVCTCILFSLFWHPTMSIQPILPNYATHTGIILRNPWSPTWSSDDLKIKVHWPM